MSSSDAERKEAIQKGKAVFGFTLKNKEGQEESWYIDLKDTGKVSKEPPKNADGMCEHAGLSISNCADCDRLLVVLSLSDDDFGKLVTGKANAQKLFMSGKLKIKGKLAASTIESNRLMKFSGNVMKATAVEPIFKKVQSKAKL